MQEIQRFHGVGIREAANATGLSYVSVWRHAHGRVGISARSALLYEEKAGIPRSVLRPDLWPPTEFPPTEPHTEEGEPHGRDDDGADRATLDISLDDIPF